MSAKPSSKGLLLALTMAVHHREDLLDQAWDDFFASSESEEHVAREKIHLAQVKLQWSIARRDKAAAEASGASHLKAVTRG